MPIYRVLAPRFARSRVKEWRRRAFRTLGLLFLGLAVCMLGLLLLDPASDPLTRKAFQALWNAANLLTTLGDFTSFTDPQKTFLLTTMLVFLIIGGSALSGLTGILSSDAVMALRENKTMQRELDRLANHVIVIGFGPLGRLVAGRLRDAGSQVLVIDRTDDNASQASELGFLVVQGDAGVDVAVLDRAAVDRARALVVTTEDPDRKLALTLMAHTCNPKLRIAVTGANDPRGALLRYAGASQVVIADELIAETLVERLGKEGGV